MPSKYKNHRVTVDGLTFDSKKEAARYGQLKLLEKAGAIHGLRHHVLYPMRINDVLVCSYEADFVYTEKGKLVVEDVKSVMTRKLPVYRLKKKLMAAIHGIEIRET